MPRIMADRLKCERHGKSVAAIVCNHVAKEGKAIARTENFGGVLAVLCSAEDHLVTEVVLVCADCAEARGWLAMPPSLEKLAGTVSDDDTKEILRAVKEGCE